MSSFHVWIDNPDSINCQTASAFENDSQRETGFKAGRVASAIRVNTALRQANLIAVALVNALGISDDFDVTSSLTNIEDWFKSTPMFKLSDVLTYNDNDVVSQKSILPGLTNINIGSDVYPWNTIYAQKFIGDLEGNATSATYADDDTTKGTIEQRLTRLGFKSLVSQVGSPLYLDDASVGTIVIQRDALGGKGGTYREGNFVTLQGQLTIYSSSGMNSNTPVYQFVFKNKSTMNAVLIQDIFRPKQTVTIYTYINTALTVYNISTQSQFDTIRKNVPIKIVINTDGTVDVKSAVSEQDDFTYLVVDTHNITALTYNFRISYEANPIE